MLSKAASGYTESRLARRRCVLGMLSFANKVSASGEIVHPSAFDYMCHEQVGYPFCITAYL